MAAPKLADVLVDALATHRITRLVIEDTITEDIREWVWKNHPPNETKWGYLFTCPHCVSVWAAGAVAVMDVLSGDNSRPRGVFRSTLTVLRYTLALSGAVSLGHEIAGKLPPTL